MDEPMSDSHFRKMCWMYKFRDFFIPRSKILSEIDIKRGFVILDYGCGPGSYSVVAARLVGETGKVYALDIHPLAIEKVKATASRKGLTNVEAIQSDCATGLENESVDVVLLCDILHHLGERDATLKELHRVLKPEGTLSVNDHHMKDHEIESMITGTRRFELRKKGKRIVNFSKTKGGKR